VVDEACFSESGLDEPCNLCPVPQDRIQIAGFVDINPSEGEDNLKRRLIQFGPLPFGISSWWHAMVLAGYQRDADTGETIWILKNSWGTDWGEHGYGFVKVNLDDIYLTYNLYSPVRSPIIPYTVACRDADGDGYYNWGISETPPESCGNIPPIKDCDDSDSTVALLTEDGRCIAAPQKDTTPPVITVAAIPSILWPPNGKMVPIRIAGTITDAGSGVDPRTTAYAVEDEYGNVEPRGGPIALGENGSYSFTIDLEASRKGNDRDGRHYTIIVSAQDNAGNEGSAATSVIVPHDQGQGRSLAAR
jgi:hypothetical protein